MITHFSNLENKITKKNILKNTDLIVSNLALHSTVHPKLLVTKMRHTFGKYMSLCKAIYKKTSQTTSAVESYCTVIYLNTGFNPVGIKIQYILTQ